MGSTAEEIKKTIDNSTPEEIAAVEAKAKADDEAKQIKEEADANKRVELEAEGKTPEEIEETLKAAEEESGEIEIVREGTQPQYSKQQVNKYVHNRVKKLNKKIVASNESNEQKTVELDLANEKNKLLQLALDQARGSSGDVLKAPNVNDFDGGTNDPEYIKQQDAYNQSIITKQVTEQVTKATKNLTNTNNEAQQSQALLSKQVKHYERADEIGAKDYEVTEDKALEILGTEVANHIIDNFDDSHVILYYLGKNPDEANRIANLLESRPIMGVAEIGRLSSELKVKSRKKSSPDPDEEISGDGSPDLSANERKLDKLREEAAKSGDMSKLMAFKRKISKKE